MLTGTDPLPRLPSRVTVAGVSGVGKTTLASDIAQVLGVPHLEIDALYHGAGWTPRATFLEDVAAFVARPGWVTEWQYRTARPLVASRAELMVWLDLPFRVTLERLLRRTLRRRLRRETLWNGNVEPPLRAFLTDREHVVRWALATRTRYRELVPAAAQEHPHLVVVRLRSRREVAAWLRALEDMSARSGPGRRPGQAQESDPRPSSSSPSSSSS